MNIDMIYIKARTTKDSLILTPNKDGKRVLEETREAFPDNEFVSDDVMKWFFEGFIANTEWEWIDPVEVHALTCAPLLGIRDKDGQVVETYGFMDYCLRSILEDLENGQAVFTKG